MDQPHVSSPVMRDVMHRREQDTAFQILERGPELDVPCARFAIARFDGILDRHGPS
jgi:hypothetical protein